LSISKVANYLANSLVARNEHKDDNKSGLSNLQVGKMKGSYILLLELCKPQLVSVGKLGVLYFAAGFYAYMGSAINGLEARIRHHFRQNKKHHWHIDYLLDWADIYEAVLIPGEGRLECILAQALNEEFSCIRSFGSSDCHCPGHLLYAANKEKLNAHVANTLTKLGITCYYQDVSTSNAAELQPKF